MSGGWIHHRDDPREYAGYHLIVCEALLDAANMAGACRGAPAPADIDRALAAAISWVLAVQEPATGAFLAAMPARGSPHPGYANSIGIQMAARLLIALRRRGAALDAPLAGCGLNLAPTPLDVLARLDRAAAATVAGIDWSFAADLERAHRACACNGGSQT